jgi:dipeptidyl aminopeptidase/acylaminoacyl peptidase
MHRSKIEQARFFGRHTWIMRWIVCILAFPFSPLFAEPTALLSTEQTPGRKLNKESAWSPDGKQIAFDSGRDGKTSIFVVDLSTHELKRLTNAGANDITPAWSPDRKKMAFLSDRTSHNEIFVMNADGSDTRQLTRDNSDYLQ